jgi:hypothetical protein
MATQLQVLTLAEAKKRYNISSKAVSRKLIPTLRTISGIYSMDEISRKREIDVVAIQPLLDASYDLVRSILHTIPGGESFHKSKSNSNIYVPGTEYQNRRLKRRKQKLNECV